MRWKYASTSTTSTLLPAKSANELPMQVVGVGRGNVHVRPIAWLQRLAPLDAHHAVDLRRIGFTSSDGDIALNRIHQHSHAAPDSPGEPLRTDLRSVLHETHATVLLYVPGHMVRESVRGRPIDG